MTLGPRYKAVLLLKCEVCYAVRTTASQLAADEEAKPDTKPELSVLCFSVSHFLKKFSGKLVFWKQIAKGRVQKIFEEFCCCSQQVPIHRMGRE
jgi:hypothetical protein